MKKIPNTITVSFKKDEVHYLQLFRNMYAVPTAIIKDFIINTVKGNSNEGIYSVNSGKQTSVENSNDIQNNMDLLDF